MKLQKIVSHLDSKLEINKIEDRSVNGLQVQNSGTVKKIGIAVDACMDTFRKAKKEGCDMILVHHGLFWNARETITKEMHTRIKYLLDNNIALYAAHLPLDKHETLGNNALLFKMLGAKPKEVFGKVGFHGEFPKPVPITQIIKVLSEKIKADGSAFLYGPEKIRTIAIVSGGGAYDIMEAIALGLDLYITGEPANMIPTVAKDAKINVICAGHYATEIVGVQAVAKHLEKTFKLKTVFLDNPTGI